MAKAVKWQIPFTSVEGTQYRLDIYAEGYTGSPIQLLAGDTPFVSDEDSNGDYFTPMRIQTGSIQICTAKPDGGLLKIEDILPANNIDHPIRLINLSNSNSIDWQGFLSCEAYSQSYIGIPTILTLPVMSVLEAMDSVFVSQNDMTEVLTLNKIIGKTLAHFDSTVGLTHFSYIYYSQTDFRIFNAGAEANEFFTQEEIQQLHSTTYSVQGYSCKSIIERLCRFMGWVARERGTNLYLSRLGESQGWYKDTPANLKDDFGTNATSGGYVSSNISALTWRGTDHKNTIMQGAKKVTVRAKLESDNVGLQMPIPPIDDPTAQQGMPIKGEAEGISVVVTLYPGIKAEQNDAYYGNCKYKYYFGSTNTPSGDVDIATTNVSTSTRSNFLSNSYMWGGLLTPGRAKYAGVALCRFYISEEEYPLYPKVQNGLYCTFLPSISDGTTPALGPQLDPIFSIKTTKKYAARLQHSQSRLKITGKCYFIGWDPVNSRAIWTDKIDDSLLNLSQVNIQLGIRWGDQVVTSNLGWDNWQGGAYIGRFNTLYKDGGFEAEVSVAYPFNGELELAIYPNAFQATLLSGSENKHVLYEVIFTSLSVVQEFSDDAAWREGSQNDYVQLLNTQFRDEIVINTEFASDNNNIPAETVLLQTDNPIGGLLKTIEYKTGLSTTQARRPELDLLSRMASYYGVSRRTLELQVKHPSFDLSLVYLYGISPDSNKYLPLAESRDWQAEISTLKCFESI